MIDRLESRSLLSTTTPVAYPTFAVSSLPNASPGSGAFTPAQIEQAYQFNQISFNGVAGTGSGETIAIVDAYNDPNIQSDVSTFDTEFGLPSINLTAGQSDRRDDTATLRSDGGLGVRRVARRGVGARNGARGEHPAGRGQLQQ